VKPASAGARPAAPSPGAGNNADGRPMSAKQKIEEDRRKQSEVRNFFYLYIILKSQSEMWKGLRSAIYLTPGQHFVNDTKCCSLSLVYIYIIY